MSKRTQITVCGDLSSFFSQNDVAPAAQVKTIGETCGLDLPTKTDDIIFLPNQMDALPLQNGVLLLR